MNDGRFAGPAAAIADAHGLQLAEDSYSFLAGPAWAVSTDRPVHTRRSVFPLFTASDHVAVRPHPQELPSIHAASPGPATSGAERRWWTSFGASVGCACGCVVPGGGAVGVGDGDVLAVGWRRVPA